MREKYESLSLAILKDLAKARGMKRISTLKKADLIERMLQQDEMDAAAQTEKQEAENREEDAGTSDAGAKTRQKNVRPSDAGTEMWREDAGSSDAEKENLQEDIRPSDSDKQKKEAAATERPERDSRRSWQKNTGNSRDMHQRTQSQRDAYHQDAAGVRDFSSESREKRDSSENVQNQFVRESSNNHKSYRNNTYNNRQEDNRNRYSKPAANLSDETGDERIRTVDDRTVQRMESEGISMSDLDSGEQADGILEVMPDGYGFIRCENYLPGDQDVYVSPSQIRRFRLKTGDIIAGNKRIRSQGEKFSALLYISCVNGMNPSVAAQRTPFEDLTPIFPNERLRLETSSSRVSMRIMDLIAPVGKGQRGMIVSQPKAGKTTLLKEIATSVKQNNPEMHLIILLIDERPEEVTDIKEAIEGDNVEVIYSTFDELPEHHKRVSEMVIERAKRLVEHKHDVMILLDSITRLARAYNMVVPPSGRTLSGGLDPGALHMPKRFFGAARNMREGGSLTILATALVDTGSRMDDVVYEEFKGTGNMELILDRKLSEKRIFPAIDIVKSGTRREDLLLNREEKEAVDIMRRALNGMKADDAVESILRMFLKTRTNREFINQVRHRKFF
ncbi:MAG: transcription termination factor Rho [Clostridiales bacterium]|nr:transcription termination factor Rho [Clostridiales bacterium]